MSDVKREQPQKSGTPRRFYMDKEANDLLDQAAVTMNAHISNIVCALIRAMSGVMPRKGEEPIYTQLKRVFGREQFLMFRKCVADMMPKLAIAHHDKEHPERDPEFWTLGAIGIWAFYNPNAENAGRVFADAIRLMNAHSLARVLVVAPHSDITPPELREGMAKAGVCVVSLTELKDVLKWPFPRGKDKAKRKPRAKK